MDMDVCYVSCTRTIITHLLITPFFRFLLQGFAQDVVKTNTVLHHQRLATSAHFSTKETQWKELYCLETKKRVRGQTFCSTSCGCRRLRPPPIKNMWRRFGIFRTFVGVAASQIRRCAVCGNPVLPILLIVTKKVLGKKVLNKIAKR